jgi:hypothetical protein
MALASRVIYAKGGAKSWYLFCSALPYWRNPNLKPVGKGFGFLVFIEQIADLN